MSALALILAALAAEPNPPALGADFKIAPAFDFGVVARGQTGNDSPYDDPASSGQIYAPESGIGHAYDPAFADLGTGDTGFLPDPGMAFGPVGPQPYRFGWTSRYDIGFIPDESVHDGGSSGKFGLMEINAAWRYTACVPPARCLIFSWTPEFNYRSWSGPSVPGLPPNVFRFASDFELATPANNPVSMQLGFTPAFVSDLATTPNSDAFNWDGRGVVFLEATPRLLVALGVAYWKRVDDIVLPYAGVVWTPSEEWELRLMFPKSRISYFLGNWVGSPAWVYGGVEYVVEAYQIGLVGPSGENEKIQLRDYRAVFGLRGEYAGVTGFIEAGWVFAREVSFLHGTPGFDINTGFIGRLGVRF